MNGTRSKTLMMPSMLKSSLAVYGGPRGFELRNQSVDVAHVETDVRNAEPSGEGPVAVLGRFGRRHARGIVAHSNELPTQNQQRVVADHPDFLGAQYATPKRQRGIQVRRVEMNVIEAVNHRAGNCS